MKTLVRVAICLVVLLGLITVAGAEEKKQLWTDPVGTFRPASPGERQAIVNNLQLTEEQQSQLQETDQRYRADVQRLADKYQKARQDLLAALNAPNPDPDRVSSDANRVQQTHSGLLSKEVEYWNSLASIMSQAQASEFWKLFARSRIRRDKGVTTRHEKFQSEIESR